MVGVVAFGIIYRVTNKINNKVYFGQTVSTLKLRWQGHKKASRNALRRKQSILAQAIHKYGEHTFLVEEFLSVSSKADLNFYEDALIKRQQDTGNSYNIRGGGSNGALSESTKQKIREKNIGKKYSLETRQKLSQMRKGKKCGPCKEETKLKISKTKTGKPHEKSKKPICLLNIYTGEIWRFAGQVDACKQLNINRWDIQNHIRGLCSLVKSTYKAI